ncbi:MAG TPA: hypothetical protein VHU44_00410 [Acidobacteriaceae bacterium]|jgi:hypothetical protein|nr:hypothetical protein [Acidobacteriaceae bacterium]
MPMNRGIQLRGAAAASVALRAGHEPGRQFAERSHYHQAGTPLHQGLP